MKSNLELNEEILEMTMNIRNNYPELSKYLEEMTITLPDDKHPLCFSMVFEGDLHNIFVN